jgi:DNA-binding transcriptional LysR family regulator
MELPQVLLVEKSSSIKSAEELWRRDKINESLICLPAGETLSKGFQMQLARLGVEWFPAIEASSADMIESYVAGGLGIGLSVEVPKNALSPKVRALPLAEFPPVLIGALWRRKMTPLLAAFLDEAKARARELSQ